MRELNLAKQHQHVTIIISKQNTANLRFRAKLRPRTRGNSQEPWHNCHNIPQTLSPDDAWQILSRQPTVAKYTPNNHCNMTWIYSTTNSSAIVATITNANITTSGNYPFRGYPPKRWYLQTTIFGGTPGWPGLRKCVAKPADLSLWIRNALFCPPPCGKAWAPPAEWHFRKALS